MKTVAEIVVVVWMPQSLMKTTPETRKDNRCFGCTWSCGVIISPSNPVNDQRSLSTHSVSYYYLSSCAVRVRLMNVASGGGGESGQRLLSFRCDKTKCVAYRPDIRRLFFCRLKHTSITHEASLASETFRLIHNGKLENIIRKGFIRFGQWHWHLKQSFTA